MTGTTTTIRPWAALAHSARATADIDAIFFSSSATTSFASDAAARAFRERWLGRYLDHDPGLAFVAVTEAGRIAGYVVGALDDPAIAPRFADIPYFPAFKDLTRRYPAHLHINCAADVRGRGVGAELIEHFARVAAAAGAPGLHVVTGAASRNRGFYARHRFHERGTWGEAEKRVVFLARDLAN